MFDNPLLPRPEDTLPASDPQVPPPPTAARSRLPPGLGGQSESLCRSLEVCCTCGQEGQRSEEAAAVCRLCGHTARSNWCILWRDRWGVLCRCCLGARANDGLFLGSRLLVRSGRASSPGSSNFTYRIATPRAVPPLRRFRRQRVDVTLCEAVFRDAAGTAAAIALAIYCIRLFRSLAVSEQVYSCPSTS